MAVEVEPTSLNKGEGLLSGSTCEVEGEDEGEGSGREVVVDEGERNSTVMGLMAD